MVKLLPDLTARSTQMGFEVLMPICGYAHSSHTAARSQYVSLSSVLLMMRWVCNRSTRNCFRHTTAPELRHLQEWCSTVLKIMLRRHRPTTSSLIPTMTELRTKSRLVLSISWSSIYSTTSSLRSINRPTKRDKAESSLNVRDVLGAIYL